MPTVPLKGQHHENWQALLASVAEKTPDVRVWSGGATKRSPPVRLLRLALAVYAAFGILLALGTLGLRHPRTDSRLYLADPHVSCWTVPAPIKNLVVMEPDKIICPVYHGRN
jgi:hypothetical protein